MKKISIRDNKNRVIVRLEQQLQNCREQNKRLINENKKVMCQIIESYRNQLVKSSASYIILTKMLMEIKRGNR